MKGFGRSHRRDVLLVKSLEGAEGYSFFRAGQKGPRGGLCPKTGEAGTDPSSWWESLVWTAVQPWKTSIASLGLSFPCANHTEGLLGCFSSKAFVHHLASLTALDKVVPGP